MAIIEVNEAFASVSLAGIKEFQPDIDRVNPNGSAILITKLVNELRQRKAQYGLQTMRAGHGQATVTIIERI